MSLGRFVLCGMPGLELLSDSCTLARNQASCASPLLVNQHLQVLLPRVRCSFFDESGNLLRVGDIYRVTGARDFDLVAVGSCGIPAFEVRIDGFVASGYQHPAWLGSPRS